MNKVLVVGGGGRCHAIVETMCKSAFVSQVYCAPGNAGIAEIATCVPIKDTDIDALLEFAEKKDIDLTIVGPEAALAAGIVDAFQAAGRKIFGPTKAATIIESSKDFAKELMDKYNVPTAGYQTFDSYEKAVEYVRGGSCPTVWKYDGLAAGKGVVIAENLAEAESALKDMLLDDKFGHGKVVIEEFLEGPEFSLMCFVNGDKVYPMPVAQDHKRAFDGDKGPNTGGMGAYTPLPFISKDDIDYAMEKIMKPVAAAMVAEGRPFCGVLYGGLMKTPSGIKVIEFNARFGDPETEVVLPRLQCDFYCLITDILDGFTPVIEWEDCATLGVVLASKGYPGSYEKGYAIEGFTKVETPLYHMGTAVSKGDLVTSGGRVMMVVAKGEDLAEARDKVYKEIKKLKCKNLFYRKDIGHWAF